MENVLNTDLMKDPQINIMAELYLSGKTLREVEGVVGRSQTYIQRRLRIAGVPFRPPGGPKIYSLNEDFFEIIDQEEKSYWVGFIAADGCILDKAPVLSLHLSSKDKNQLEKFKKTLDSNKPIYNNIINEKRKYPACIITIQSKKIKTDLIDKGIIPRKSLVLKPPKNIPNHLIRHWIRGYFDGDGSVYYARCRTYPQLRASITGTREVLEFILDQVELNQCTIQSNSKVFTFRTSGRKSLQLYHYMYDEATIYMERKKKKFDQYIQWRKVYQAIKKNKRIGFLV